MSKLLTCTVYQNIKQSYTKTLLHLLNVRPVERTGPLIRVESKQRGRSGVWNQRHVMQQPLGPLLIIQRTSHNLGHISCYHSSAVTLHLAEVVGEWLDQRRLDGADWEPEEDESPLGVRCGPVQWYPAERVSALFWIIHPLLNKRHPLCVYAHVDMAARARLDPKKTPWLTWIREGFCCDMMSEGDPNFVA